MEIDKSKSLGSSNRPEGVSPENMMETETMKPKSTNFDIIASEVAKQLCECVHSQESRARVKTNVLNIMRTISELNKLGEYSRSIRVKGDLFPLSEYKVLEGLEHFVVPAKVVVKNDSWFKDILKHSEYTMTLGKILSPEDMDKAQIFLCRELRVSNPLKTINRDPLLLADAVTSMAEGDMIHAANQVKLLYLNSDVVVEGYCGTKQSRFITHWVNNFLQ